MRYLSYLPRPAMCIVWLGLALGSPGCKRSPAASPPTESAPASGPAKPAPADPAPGSASSSTSSMAPADISDEIAGVHVIERTLGGALPEERLPAIVALHPLDGDPTGFYDLLGSYPKKARLVLPHGQPVGGGYRWFDFSPATGASGLPAAVERVAGVLRASSSARSARPKACYLPDFRTTRPIFPSLLRRGIVMNSRAEIQQAFFDYQRTHGLVTAPRFAKHADGKLWRPS